MFPIIIIVKVSQIFVTFTVRKVVTCNNSMQDEKIEICAGKPVLGQLVDDYLLDFDIFHVSHVTGKKPYQNLLLKITKYVYIHVYI